MIKQHLFHLVIVVLAVVLAGISFFYKDHTEAMTAVVEPQIKAISYRKAVVVDKIHVVPGQEIQKGQPIIEVTRPDLELDLEKLNTDLSRIGIELQTLESDYQHQIELRNIAYLSERYRLQSEISEEHLEIEHSQSLLSGLKGLTEQNLEPDSALKLRVKVLENQLASLENRHNQQLKREHLLFQNEKSLMEKQLALTNMELEAIKAETSDLVRFANVPGTIGSINVQVGELIPPFKTLITVYGSQPSMIRAFMNEEISYQVKVGDQVWVESENRLYRIPGEVVEIGTRITPFPDKIDNNPERPRYGQEVYVQISDNSQFLSGEKVFVYPVEIP